MFRGRRVRLYFSTYDIGGDLSEVTARVIYSSERPIDQAARFCPGCAVCTHSDFRKR